MARRNQIAQLKCNKEKRCRSFIASLQWSKLKTHFYKLHFEVRKSEETGCVYMYVCVYACMHIQVCTYVCMHVCMHVCMYVGLYIYIYMCVCVCVCVFRTPYTYRPITDIYKLDNVTERHVFKHS